ncbi:MAG: hypothetical protein ACO3UU_00785 [Minisyncoccia bacterium]
MHISFDEKNHVYTNVNTEDNYISVTTLLSRFKPKFDVDAQAAIFAAKHNLLVEDVKQYWNDLNRISTTRGTAIHNILENYINTGSADTDEQKELIQYIKKQLQDHAGYKVTAEELMYNDLYQVAGTADIVLENNKFFKIWDLKTNKKFRFTNNFNKDTFLLSPVEHLPNCEYSNYSLQLSMYAFMKEQLTGKKCTELKIIYLKTNTVTQENTVEEYYISYLKKDIQEILEQIKK